MHQHLCALRGFVIVCSLGVLAALGTGQESSASRSAAVHVPSVRQLQVGRGAFPLAADVPIVFAAEELAPHARVLVEELAMLTGLQARVAPVTATSDLRGRDGSGPTIVLELTTGESVPRDAAGLPAEGYELSISANCIVAKAPTLVGLSWATSTLLQSVVVGPDGAATVSCLAIRDQPRAPYRSLMIDVARQPHSIAVLEGVVRIARLYRIRFVHLHLTDDQHFTFPFAPVVDNLKANASYNRAELVGLVKYATARGVTLVPEIDLPGHSSRLRESGYLAGAKTDRDVASAEQWPALSVLVDDVIDVFGSLPYFHVGGDESGAGRELVPFLKRANQHVRKRGKRLIVWEGFHGAPLEDLPAAGEDRILVAAWESSYNAPWDLLSSGYELINASWCPLYIVGGDSRIHPGSTAGRKWPAKTLATWHKDRFMHWEPGRPVFEDRGPGDQNRDDGIWDVADRDHRARILGGQICVWEQRESSLLRDLRTRAPIVAERLWSGQKLAVDELLSRCNEVDRRVWSVVQPIEIRLPAAVSSAMESVARMYSGGEVEVSLHNVSRAPGRIRWSKARFAGDWNWIDFSQPGEPNQSSPEDKFVVQGGATVRAQLLSPDGRAIGAETWMRCLNWPMRVRVTEYDIGRRVPKARDNGLLIPDFDQIGVSAVTASYELPMIRGPLDHVAVKGQRFEAVVVAPGTGKYAIGVKTQSGHATLWFDQDRDGEFAAGERLIRETPNTEERLTAQVELRRGQRYRLRVDHVTALPRPVLIVTLDQPGAKRPREISAHLALLPAKADESVEGR